MRRRSAGERRRDSGGGGSGRRLLQFGDDTEWAEYDPSADTIWCVLSYEGEGDPLEFGSEYRLEVRTDSGWEQVPFAEGTGWDDILYTLPAGESWAFPCVLSLFGCDFTEGTYRVVKEVAVLPSGGVHPALEAEFTLAEGARISAETPYGFWPLEDVPEEAHPSELAEGGAVVFTEAGTENADCGGDLPGQGRPWASPASCGRSRTTTRAGPC